MTKDFDGRPRTEEIKDQKEKEIHVGETMHASAIAAAPDDESIVVFFFVAIIVVVVPVARLWIGGGEMDIWSRTAGILIAPCCICSREQE